MDFQPMRKFQRLGIPSERDSWKKCACSWPIAGSRGSTSAGAPRPLDLHCTELATDEKTLFAFEPTSRMVPMTITRMTASITAYSAMSWPFSSDHRHAMSLDIYTSGSCAHYYTLLQASLQQFLLRGIKGECA